MATPRKTAPRLIRRKDKQLNADEDLRDFEILTDLVGKGSYSNIYKARNLKNPEGPLVVAKVSNKHAKRADINYRGAVDCLSSLSQEPHDNIVKLVGHQETKNNFYEFLEYLEKPVMTLSELMKANGGTLSPTIALNIFAQLVSALYHLHSRGFGHRDLKPDNIMINPVTLHVTLIDFGFAMRTNALCEDFSGSPIYAAPEILNFDAYLVDQADLWSLGVVLYQMLFGAYPYPAKDLQELTNKVNRDPLNFPSIPPSQDSELLSYLITIIRALMVRDPSKRISASELFERLIGKKASEGDKMPAEDNVDAMDVVLPDKEVVSSSLS